MPEHGVRRRHGRDPAPARGKTRETKKKEGRGGEEREVDDAERTSSQKMCD